MSEIVAVFMISVGMWIGMSLEARRWRRNAGEMRRIESSGVLFKVLTNDAHEQLLRDASPE